MVQGPAGKREKLWFEVIGSVCGSMVSHTVVQFRPEHLAGSLFQTTPRIGFGSLALFSLALQTI